jgi:type I restriction-modification system DNA methylase subunit
VFDRYNFTVNEAEPLEKEVAIDPEMLGKVFENLLEVKERKSKGSFYTPREIVHYMCQESLINYLNTNVNSHAEKTNQSLHTAPTLKELVPRADIELWIHQSDQFASFATAIAAGTKGEHYPKPPKPIESNARLLDEKLADIAVCDPAIGSGAFPVGMMQEIVRARSALTPYFNDVRDRTPYHFKRHAIQNCLYGVDIDSGAVEIAKLRLWLSLVVDEDDVKQIKPLPNLDYKVVSGNSLLSVEKNLFNVDLFSRLEDLKPRYFDATDRKQKEKFKLEIDDLIQELTNGKEAFDFEIYFSEIFHKKGGFDVMIANPPYGANIDKLLPVLRPVYKEAIQNYADIYKMFIQLGLRKIRSGGIQSLITPNTFVAQPRYRDIRKVLVQHQIVKVINLGEEVFEGVVVPTCLSFVIRENPEKAYFFADLSKESKFSGNLSSIAFRSASLKQVNSSKDLSLYVGKILGENEVLFDEALEIKDAGIQYHRSGIVLKNKGGNDLYERLFNSNAKAFKTSVPVWYGKLMNRWVINPKTDEFFNLDYRKILKSNESTSFSENTFGVTPKILWRQTASCLRATIDTEGRWFRNTIQCAYIKQPYEKQLDIYFVLGIVNSMYIEYVYNALVKEAGRVFPQVKLTHVKKLPLVIAQKNDQKKVSDLVKRILSAKAHDAEADVSALAREIDGLVYALYGLTKEEIAIIEGSRR